MDQTPFHKRHVHPFIGWMVLLNAAMIGVIPGLLFAQESGSNPPPPPPPAASEACFSDCEARKQECFNQSGGNPETQQKCQEAAQQCFGSCQGQTGGTPPPPPPPPPPAPSSTGTNECALKCEEAMRGCMSQAGDNPEARQKCESEAKPCFTSCPQPQTGGQFGQSPSGGFPPPGGQFGPPPGGQFGPPPGGQFGPQGEHSGPENDERMQAQQKQLMERVKKQMGGVAKNLSRIKSRLAALEKKGVVIPAELKKAVQDMEDAIAKIKAAESPEELADVGEVMQEAGQIIQEQLGNVERMSQLPRIYSRVNSEIKKLERYLANDRRLAARSKIDLTDALTDLEKGLNDLKAAYASAKEKLAAGDFDEGFDLLEQGVFEAIPDVFQHHAAIQQIGRLQSSLTQINREINRFASQLKRVKGEAAAVAEAQATLDEARAKLAELKTAATTKPIDPETIFEILEEMDDIRERFLDKYNALRGVQEKKAIDAGIKVQEFDIPDFSGFGGGNGGEGGPQPTDRQPLF